MKYLFLYVPDLIWFNRRYCISVKQIHRGEVSYSPKRSFIFTKKTQIISIWYCSDQLPTSMPERVIYLFIIYRFTSLFIYLSIYLFIYLFIYLLYLMSIPREAQKQEKNSFKRSVKILEKTPVLESLFGQISILQPSNSLRMEGPAKHTAWILI